MKKDYFIRELINNSEKKLFFEVSEKASGVFGSHKWLSLSNNNLKLFGIFTSENELIGGFYLLFKKKYFFTLIRKPLFTPYNGLFFSNPGNNSVTINNLNKKIYAMVAEFLLNLKGYSISFYMNPKHKDMQEFIWKKFDVTPNFTYQIDLSKSIEELKSNIHHSKLRNIKSTNNKGVICKLSNNINEIKSMISHNHSLQNKIKDLKFFDKILDNFNTDKDSFSYISYLDEKAIAFAYCIHDENTAYFIMGSHDKSHNGIYPGPLSMYNSILHAKELGLHYFDFEGSMIPEVEQFYRSFGGELIPYYAIKKENILVKLLNILTR
ncbi:MAG: GNAT family N-acetyltransferase [Saprospiraceae bacterium]